MKGTAMGMTTQLIQRQKLHGLRSPIVERSTTWTVTARPDSSSFQSEIENTLFGLGYSWDRGA